MKHYNNLNSLPCENYESLTERKGLPYFNKHLKLEVCIRIDWVNFSITLKFCLQKDCKEVISPPHLWQMLEVFSISDLDVVMFHPSLPVKFYVRMRKSMVISQFGTRVSLQEISSFQSLTDDIHIYISLTDYHYEHQNYQQNSCYFRKLVSHDLLVSANLVAFIPYSTCHDTNLKHSY